MRKVVTYHPDELIESNRKTNLALSYVVPEDSDYQRFFMSSLWSDKNSILSKSFSKSMLWPNPEFIFDFIADRPVLSIHVEDINENDIPKFEKFVDEQWVRLAKNGVAQSEIDDYLKVSEQTLIEGMPGPYTIRTNISGQWSRSPEYKDLLNQALKQHPLI